MWTRFCRRQPLSSFMRVRQPAQSSEAPSNSDADLDLRADPKAQWNFRRNSRLRMIHSRLLFGGTVFLASFLLFLVEPIAAKQLLPVFGGSAAVWITCLVFFQTALLVAYLYAHWLAQRSHWIVHFVLLLLAAASAIVWSHPDHSHHQPAIGTSHLLHLCRTRHLHRRSLSDARRNQPAVAGVAGPA